MTQSQILHWNKWISIAETCLEMDFEEGCWNSIFRAVTGFTWLTVSESSITDQNFTDFDNNYA